MFGYVDSSFRILRSTVNSWYIDVVGSWNMLAGCNYRLKKQFNVYINISSYQFTEPLFQINLSYSHFGYK